MDWLDVIQTVGIPMACFLISAFGCKYVYDKESENAEKVQVVVFSPGATSFGMFKNEFDRGNQFKAKVKKVF